MRVTVVGAGIMGLSTAWALARRGHAVRLVDRGAIPDPLASSWDESRLIRYPYGGMAGYAAMVTEAFEAWERLWADLGERHYAETGALVLGGRGDPWCRDSARTLEGLGLRVDRLSPAEVGRRFPVLGVEGVAEAFHLPSGGVLWAERILEGLAAWLSSRGVELLPGHEVAAVDPEGATVRLVGGGALEADVTVAAPGVRAASLVPGLASRVTPSRQVLAYLDVDAPVAAAWERMPMVLALEADRGFYAVPPRGGTRLKLGDHRFSLAGDPETDRAAGPDEGGVLLAACADRLAEAHRYRIAATRVCFYSVEPRERFIVEPVGPATWVLAGFSGHGFKFGPRVGEAVADVLEGRRSGDALTRWAAGHTEGAPRGRTGQ